MDTKLKNRHKLAIFFIMITILIPSLAMMTGYFGWYQMKTETKTKAFKNAEKSSDFWDIFWRVRICSIIQKVEESTQMMLKNLCMIPTMQKCQSIHILILIWTIGCLMKMAVMLKKVRSVQGRI